MNCSGKKGILKHGLLMILCCILPIIALIGLPLLGIKGVAFSSLAFLLCPLMHIVMMFMMKKSDNKDCHGENIDNLDTQKINTIEIEKKEYKVLDSKN